MLPTFKAWLGPEISMLPMCRLVTMYMGGWVLPTCARVVPVYPVVPLMVIALTITLTHIFIRLALRVFWHGCISLLRLLYEDRTPASTSCASPFASDRVRVTRIVILYLMETHREELLAPALALALILISSEGTEKRPS